MEKFTLLELHLDGETSFSPSIARGSTGGDDDVTEDLDADFDLDDGDDSDDASESTGPGPVGLLVGLIALVVVAAGVRRLVGGGEETDEYEPEMVEIEE